MSIHDKIPNDLKEKIILGNKRLELACDVVLNRRYYYKNLMMDYYNLTEDEHKKILATIKHYDLKRRLLSRPSIGLSHKAKLSRGGTPKPKP